MYIAVSHDWHSACAKTSLMYVYIEAHFQRNTKIMSFFRGYNIFGSETDFILLLIWLLLLLMMAFCSEREKNRSRSDCSGDAIA